MEVKYIPHRICTTCMRKQWIVESSWKSKITRNKNETDKSLKKRQRENEKKLKKAICQYCSNHGERFNLDSHKLRDMF